MRLACGLARVVEPLRFLLCLLACGTALAQPLPVSGAPNPAFEGADRVVGEHLQRIGARAATLAVSRAGALVHTRGFGHADQGRTRPTPPDALLRIASVTKPITAAAVRRLIAAGRLSMSESVYMLLDLSLERPRDPRWSAITVRHLLEHRGGWDRNGTLDPMFHVEEIARSLGLKTPARPKDLLRYMLRQPLQFTPGERIAYSNFGYSVLGRVVERAARTSFINYVRQAVLGPYAIDDILLGRSQFGSRYAREVDYPAGGGFALEANDSAGGLVASAPALVRFMRYYWLNGVPREPGAHGSYTYFGSLPGTTALVRQLADGTDYAVLMNARREGAYREDNRMLAARLDAALRAAPLPSAARRP